MNLLLRSPDFLAEVAPGPAVSGNAFAVWAGFFAITLAMELPAIAFLWRLRGGPGSLRTWLFAGLLGNGLSHPIATGLWWWLGLPPGGGAAIAAYGAIELGVIVLEAWVFRRRATAAWPEAFVMAAGANLFTAVLGLYYVIYG